MEATNGQAWEWDLINHKFYTSDRVKENLGFEGDERGVGIYKIPEFKRSSQVIPNATNQIYGIEMGGRLPSRTLLS